MSEFDISNIFKNAIEFVDNHKLLVASTVTAGIGLATLKRHYAGGVCKSRAQMHNKTVIITGANTGIGRETARDLARRGAHVLLACRDVTKAERTAADIRRTTGNNNVEVYILDLASLKSVRQCAQKILAKETKIDVLINNAGVMWTPQWKTEDGFEMQFGTNHLGHFLFTNLLLDRIKMSAPSRIINVSSLAHTRGKINFDDINLEKDYSPRSAYAQSKLANVLFTRELSKRLQEGSHPVTVNAVHPGAVDTELPRHVSIMINNVILQCVINVLYYAIVRPIFMKSSKQGAQTSIQCAIAPELSTVTGKYFSDCAVKEEAPQAQDDEAAAKLWTLSEHMVGLTDNT